MENTKESPVSAAVIVSSNKITNQENTSQLHTVHTPPGDTYKISNNYVFWSSLQNSGHRG